MSKLPAISMSSTAIAGHLPPSIKKNTSIATINVGAGLEAGLADGKGALFVDGAEKHDIVKIDAKSNKVEAHFDMPACKKPHGLALDSDTHRLFATCANNILVVVDADNCEFLNPMP